MGWKRRLSDRGGAAQGDRREERDEEPFRPRFQRILQGSDGCAKGRGRRIGLSLCRSPADGAHRRFQAQPAARPVFPLGRQRAPAGEGRGAAVKNTAPMSCR